MCQGKPLVSIVIPAYNAERYIEGCIQSILNQSFALFEIIIVDDGSLDSTSELCDELSKRDCRVIAFHKVNGGATSARRFGVEKARGEWIMFVDADDTMPSGALNDLLDHNDGKSDIIAGTILYKTRNRVIKTVSDSSIIDPQVYIRLLLSRQTYFGPCSKLIKRSLFDGLKWNDDPQLFQNEDLLMLVLLSVKCTQHISISNDYVHYICEDKAGSMSTRHMSYEGWKMLFCELRETIRGVADTTSELFASYVNYTIWNIYDCLLTQAINIPQDQFLKKLIEDSKNVIVEEKNVKVLALLSKPTRRVIFCKYRWIRMSAKRILGHIIKLDKCF